MRIVLAAALYPPQEGGPATYAKLLVDALPKLGVEVSPVLFSSVYTYPVGVRHMVYMWRLYRAGRTATLVYAQDPVSVGVPSAFAALLLRKPLVVKVVGDHVWEQGTQRFGATETLDQFPVFSLGWHPYLMMLRMLQRFVLWRAEKIVVPSQYLKNIVGQWGAFSSKIVVVHNGVDFSEQPIVPQVDVELQSTVLVTSARLVPWKGIGPLIDIVAKEPTWSLIIIGDGPIRKKLEEQVSSLLLSNRVLFTGSLSHARALGWYARADVFVLNSSYEGLSHTLLEVMHLGKPIVTTKVGGNPELLVDGESGLLVMPNNSDELHRALMRVCTDAELRVRLGRAAQQIAQHFSIQKTLSELVVVLQSCES